MQKIYREEGKYRKISLQVFKEKSHQDLKLIVENREVT